MYNFKVINISIPDNVFEEVCFMAVGDAKVKLNSNDLVPANLKKGIFLCNGTTSENLTVANIISKYFERKGFIKGVDFTINFLIEN